MYLFPEIVLLAFPQTDGLRSKKRPALCLLDSGDDFIFAKITSHSPRTSSDVVIEDWQKANLLFPSCIRLDKLITLEKTLVLRRFGTLTNSDAEKVRSVIKNLWSNL